MADVRVYVLWYTLDGFDNHLTEIRATTEEEALDIFFTETGLRETNIFRISYKEDQ